MNKGELVRAVASAAGTTRVTVEEVIDSLVGEIESAIFRGDRVSLPGFGTFERRDRAARIGRNPRTGASIQIQASRVPAFRAGSEFKAVVNGMAPVKKAAKKKAAKKKSTARKPAKKAAKKR